MTVTELIQALNAVVDKYGPDIPVILSKDAEGNLYSPASEVDVAMYSPESTYSGEHYLLESDRQALEDPDDYSEAPEDAVTAVFLWPVN